jgi:hypothetical protein
LRGSWFWASLGKKFSKVHLTGKKAEHGGPMPAIPATAGNIKHEDCGPGRPKTESKSLSPK